MYVLECRVRQISGGRTKYRWIEYAVCTRRSPLERVRKGLGSSGWRVRETDAAIKRAA